MESSIHVSGISENLSTQSCMISSVFFDNSSLWTVGVSKLSMSIHQNFDPPFWKSEGEKEKITFGFFDIHALDVCV